MAPTSPSLRLTAALGGVLIAAAIGGCGIANPYNSTTANPTTSTAAVSATVTDPTPVHERNGTIPAAAAAQQKKLAAGAAARSPQAALTRFARLYVNWTSRTVAANQRKLAAISLDGARAQALQAAESYGSDSVLQTSQITNTGQVLAISPGSASAAGSWVLVTRETTSGSGDYQGLPAEDRIYLAGLTHTNRGWVINTWTPQS